MGAHSAPRRPKICFLRSQGNRLFDRGGVLRTVDGNADPKARSIALSERDSVSKRVPSISNRIPRMVVVPFFNDILVFLLLSSVPSTRLPTSSQMKSDGLQQDSSHHTNFSYNRSFTSQGITGQTTMYAYIDGSVHHTYIPLNMSVCLYVWNTMYGRNPHLRCLVWFDPLLHFITSPCHNTGIKRLWKNNQCAVLVCCLLLEARCRQSWWLPGWADDGLL